MENKNVEYMGKALGLERRIVGVNFLAYRTEYDECPAKESERKGTFCSFVNRASHGEVLKVCGKHFACQGGALAIGVKDEPERTRSGRIYEHCGLYGSHAIARSVNEGMTHIEHKIYGVMVGPLGEIEDADVVIILGTAKQMMRIVQGYTYEYGVAEHLSTVGNQAMCSDLCAKPFMNNDINFSFMCCGARINTRCSDGEMGASMPVQMFKHVVNGVLQTLNLTEPNSVKEEILSRLSDPMELGVEIRMNDSYGKNAGQYQKRAMEMEADEAEGYDRAVH